MTDPFPNGWRHAHAGQRSISMNRLSDVIFGALHQTFHELSTVFQVSPAKTL